MYIEMHSIRLHTELTERPRCTNIYLQLCLGSCLLVFTLIYVCMQFCFCTLFLINAPNQLLGEIIPFVAYFLLKEIIFVSLVQ